MSIGPGIALPRCLCANSISSLRKVGRGKVVWVILGEGRRRVEEGSCSQVPPPSLSSDLHVGERVCFQEAEGDGLGGLIVRLLLV